MRSEADMSSHSEPIGHGYTVLRAVVNRDQNYHVPIGVVAWDSTREWYGIRTARAGERIPGVSASSRQFADIVVAQLDRWASKKAVPYADAPVVPWNSAFWSAASQVLTTAIRADQPRALDPQTDTRAGLEALFEAVVQPGQPRAQAARRIDGALTEALGAYSRFFETRAEVDAYEGATERVLRRAASTSGELILEAVNLAASHARRDADALVSKLLRIREAHSSTPLAFMVGYVASPNGLNGETHMRDWIAHRITPEVYDLRAQHELFQVRTAAYLDDFGLLPEPGLNGLDST